MKKIIIMMIAVVALFVIACGKKTKDVDDKVYYIGLSADFAPFEYREGEKIVGFDPELAELISKETGLKFEIKDMAFSGLLAALQSGKIDIILSGMSVTEERKKAVNFTKPYFDIAQVIIVREDNNDIKEETDLLGKSIGVQMGTTSDTLAQKIEGISLKQYESAYGAILDLNSKKLDAIVLDIQQAKNFVKANDGIKIAEKELQKEQYAMAISKENTDLLEKIDSALDKILVSDEYAALMKKYIK
jgi:polar amino acid transport system substrate-binding protein